MYDLELRYALYHQRSFVSNNVIDAMLVFAYVPRAACSQYEERELQAQEDRAKRRMDFDNQKMRLQNQLEFEKTKETYGECEAACAAGWREIRMTLM